MNATRVGSDCAVRLEKAPDLVDDVIESPRLVASGCCHPVAVHRIGDPQRIRLARLDRFKQWRKGIPNLACAHPGNEGEPAGFAVRVKRVDQTQQVLC